MNENTNNEKIAGHTETAHVTSSDSHTADVATKSRRQRKLKPKTSKLCIWSLVLGVMWPVAIVGSIWMGWTSLVVGVLCAVLATIFGGAGLVKVNKSKRRLKGGGLGLAGVITGGIGTAVYMILVLAIAVCSTESPVPSKGELSKQAWDEMKRTKRSLGYLMETNPIKYCEDVSHQLRQINTVKIDEDLRRLIDDNIRIANSCRSTMIEYGRKFDELSHGVEDAAALGAAIGSMDENNPEGGAALGALLLGFIGALDTGTRTDVVEREYKSALASLQREGSALARREKVVAAKLKRRYGYEFN